MSRARRNPTWLHHPQFEAFRHVYSEQPSGILIFVGSGLSIGGGLPSWENLLNAIKSTAEDQRISLELGDDFAEALRAGEYPKAGSLLQAAFRKKDPDLYLWQQIIRDILANGKCTVAHSALARLKWNKIITTNYDNLIEIACAAEIEPAKVYHPWMPDKFKVMHPGRSIFKIHGDIYDDRSQLILSENDYREIYEGGSELGNWFRETLFFMLASAPVILFIGYSHDDPYVQARVQEIREKRIESQIFALVPVPSQEERAAFDNKAEQLLLTAHIHLIPYDPSDKHRELQECLEYLSSPDAYADSTPRKRPIAVLLYTGGTIGSRRHVLSNSNEELGVEIMKSRFEKDLSDLSQILKRRFRQFYNTRSDPQFDLKWEVLPEDQQILSENATPEHWNNVLQKLDDVIYKYIEGPRLVGNTYELHDERLKKIFAEEHASFKRSFPEGGWSEINFIDEFKDSYVVGIIVLHGTDTLAYTAAALSFSIQHLPCPVVVTGANNPPNLELLTEQSEFYWESDTWKNLVTSLYFLQCLGHRLTELFVCFGDTVHHGVNLRKTAIDMVPLRRASVSRHGLEPFTFRNYSLFRQYMFRAVDGIFCNNYYPIDHLHYQEIIGEGATGIPLLRHARRDPFRPSERTTFDHFNPLIVYLKTSPAFPHIDAPAMLLWAESPVRAVLIEGYKSGTYPTTESNYFSTFIRDLFDEGIPVILVSHYGIMVTQGKYETIPIKGTPVPVLRLFGIIAETALPLLSLVIDRIDESLWNDATHSVSIVEHRISLIRLELNRFLAERINIVSVELGDILDQSVMYRTARTIAERELENEGRSRLDSVRLLVEPPGDNMEIENRVIMYRNDLLWYLDEVVRPFAAVGAGPDGFAILSDMGFNWAFESLLTFQRRSAKRSERSTFLNQSPDRRKDLVTTADQIIERVASALGRTGFARVRTESITIDEGGKKGLADFSRTQSFSFVVEIERQDDQVRRDERYAVQSYSRGEAEFFEYLQGSAPREAELTNYIQELESMYMRLLKDSWLEKTASIDWFLIGVFKAVACAVACYLHFDKWSVQYNLHPDMAHMRPLRQSVKTDVLLGTDQILKLHLSYYGWES